MCPTGGNGCSQWGRHGEQQVGLYRVYVGFMSGLSTAQQEEERRAWVGLEEPRVWSPLSSPLTLHLQKHPERICSHGTSGDIVQTKARAGWHWEPRSAVWICSRDPDPWLLLPRFPSWHAEDALGCHAGLSSGSTCGYFLSSLGPFVQGSRGRATNCICRKGRSSRAAVSKMDVGLSEHSPRDPGRRHLWCARLQLFAKAS